MNPNMNNDRPLFEHFDQIGQRLASPHLAADLPTPVQALPGVADNLWIKRDDLTGAGYGGNKIRKLEFVLPQAKKRGARRIITVGGLGTHHGLATAICCRALELECEILLFDQPITPHVRDNLLLMQHFGAQLRYKGSMPRTPAAYTLHPRRIDPRCYFLFAGASNPIGVSAYINAALELDAQITAGETPEPAAVYCAVGSTGTLAGLTLGMALCGRQIPVRGVRVIDSHLGPFAACTSATVSKLMRQTLRWLRSVDDNFPALDIPEPQLLDDYFGEGYGAPTAAGEHAMSVAQAQRLTLDPTYTAKAFAAALDGCKRETGPVLYWHTLASRDFSNALRESEVTALPRALQTRLKDR